MCRYISGSGPASPHCQRHLAAFLCWWLGAHLLRIDLREWAGLIDHFHFPVPYHCPLRFKLQTEFCFLASLGWIVWESLCLRRRYWCPDSWDVHKITSQYKPDTVDGPEVSGFYSPWPLVVCQAQGPEHFGGKLQQITWIIIRQKSQWAAATW